MSHPAAILPFSFFFNDTATTEIYTLSLHDALPIFRHALHPTGHECLGIASSNGLGDRKSTRLNSSHRTISYAVFGLKKKKRKTCATITRYETQRLHPDWNISSII